MQCASVWQDVDVGLVKAWSFFSLGFSGGWLCSWYAVCSPQTPVISCRDSCSLLLSIIVEHYYFRIVAVLMQFYCDLQTCCQLEESINQTTVCFHFTTVFVLDYLYLNTAISVDVQLVFSSHLASIVMKSSLAVIFAKRNPGMSGIGRSVWDCWASLPIITIWVQWFVLVYWLGYVFHVTDR